MFGFWLIYKREVKSYFQSPSTYVVMALLFFVVGMMF
jgi:ABC-type transport system involved in multi-copper enzyme maturation permease subunit